MHKIGISCAISIAVERFRDAIFLINGNFRDEKIIYSLILVSCLSRIFMKRKLSNNL